jgi:hypothetical protein
LRVALPRARLRICPVGFVRDGSGFGAPLGLLGSAMAAPCSLRL